MTRNQPVVTVVPLEQAGVTPDPHNARLHTPRNIGVIENSMHADGAGRSILVDQHGVTIAGAGAWEAATQAGIARAAVIETDGDTLVVVKRTVTPEQRLRMALADNRATDLSTWDADRLRDLQAQAPEVEIARREGVDPSVISRIKKRVEKRITAETDGKAQSLKARQIGEIRRARREAWRAWEESCKPSAKTMRRSGGKGAGTMEAVTAHGRIVGRGRRRLVQTESDSSSGATPSLYIAAFSLLTRPVFGDAEPLESGTIHHRAHRGARNRVVCGGLGG